MVPESNGCKPVERRNELLVKLLPKWNSVRSAVLVTPKNVHYVRRLGAVARNARRCGMFEWTVTLVGQESLGCKPAAFWKLDSRRKKLA